MSPSRAIPGCLLIVSLFVGCADPPTAPPDWCAGAHGDPSIAFSADPEKDLRLREVWRRGGLRDGEELARPGAPAIDRAGRVAMIDQALGEIVVIDPDGDWLGTVVRQGNGPGDVRVPAAVAWDAHGSLLILDFGRMVISRREIPSGRVIDERPIPEDAVRRLFEAGEMHWSSFSLTPRGDLLTEPRLPTGADPGTRVLAQALRFHGDDPAAEPDVLMGLETAALTKGRTLVPPGFPQPLVGVGMDGTLAVAGDTERYRVRILSAAGGDSLVVCRNRDGLPLTRLELGDTLLDLASTDPAEREREDLRRWLSEGPRPEMPLAMGRIFLGATGRLWVQRDRENPFRLGPPLGATYDVFAPGGDYLGTVATPVGVVLYGESEELVIGYAVGELDETSIVAFELTPLHPRTLTDIPLDE